MALNQDEHKKQIDNDFEKGKVGFPRLNTGDAFSKQHMTSYRKKLMAQFHESMTRKAEIKDLVKVHVLHLLPAKSLARFRSVSSEWDEWIKNPLFALHQSYSFNDLSGYFCQYDQGYPAFVSLNHSTYGVPTLPLQFLPDYVNIRSSSGGLLLCQGRNNNSYYICNPVTQNWKQLPDPEYYHDREKTAVVLAFEPSLLNIQAHYQVICAFHVHDQPNVVYFQVYSSETRSWKLSNSICFELGSPSFYGSGFFFKGNAYWQTTYHGILAFDVIKDTFEVIELPIENLLKGVLAVVKNELCYVGFSIDPHEEYSLKINGGIRFQSESVFDLRQNLATYEIQGHPPYMVLPCLEDGVVMILVGSSIYACRLKEQSVELMSREGVGSSFDAITYLPYVNSLVSVS